MYKRQVFKGLARYDGLPVIAEGFFAIKVNSSSSDPATSSTFPVDYANPTLDSLTITSAAGASKGGTVPVSYTHLRSGILLGRGELQQ